MVAAVRIAAAAQSRDSWREPGYCFAHWRWRASVAGAGRACSPGQPAGTANDCAQFFLHQLPPHCACARRADHRNRNSQTAARVHAFLQSGQTAHGRHQHSGGRHGDGLERVRESRARAVRLWRCRRHSFARDACRRGCSGSALERSCGGARASGSGPDHLAHQRSSWVGRVPARRRQEFGRQIPVGAAGGGCLKAAGKIAGQPVPHESASEHVTGDALYTDDLVLRFPRALHAWPVLSPHAHALVKSLDLSAALLEPGVATVLTEQDVPGEGNSGSNRHDEPLFPTEVMYHSQPVLWVLGETLEAARRGADRVLVEYEPLPAVLTIEDAILAGSFHSAPLRLARGDASVIESSPLRFEGELRIGGQEHFHLETQCAIAWMDESGGVAAHSSTQHPTETQEVIARVLGIPRNKVTVECVRMGGAFGGKEVQANPYAAIAAWAAWKTRRPVRVRLTRALDFALTGKRHPFLARYVAGFTRDGCLEGVRIALYSDGGWSLDLSEPVLSRAMFHCDNAYLLPAVEVTGLICRTHKTSQTAFRGFGGPQGMLVIEEILDQAGRRLWLPPELVRERTFYRGGDTPHH